jgi:hypothetical protein
VAGKGYKPENDPGNYLNGMYIPGLSGRRAMGGGGGGGNRHGEYNRGYGGWQFDYDPWSSNLAQQAAQERVGRLRTNQGSTMGPYEMLFDEMRRDYRSKESSQRAQQTTSHQMDILRGMQQLGYFPYAENVIPGGYMPGQGVRSMMGMGGQQQRATPSLMNFFSQLGGMTGRQMFPSFGFGGQQG